jgi:hypothetical protein
LPAPSRPSITKNFIINLFSLSANVIMKGQRRKSKPNY